jgi:TetR/AcrR family transcriptional repressor of mexJK operon
MPIIRSVKTRSYEKRTNLLRVAGEMFLERGYDAVSLDDILSRTGGSKTTLYSYYGGKEGLFAAMVQKKCQDKLAPMRELEVSQMDPEAGLTAIGRRFLNCVTDDEGRSFYRMIIAESERFPALAAEFFAAGPDMVQSVVRQNLERWQRTGLLRGGNAGKLAVQFIGIMLGDFSVRSLLKLSPVLSEKEIRDWVSRGVNLFLEGARSR